MSNGRNDPARYLVNVSDAALMPRWRDLVAKVRSELLNLNIDRRIMQDAVAVFNANDRLLNHTGRFRFLDAIRTWYGLAMSIAIRRQLDPDRRSASLRVLMRELRARPGAYRVATLRPIFPHASDASIETLGLSLKNASGSIDLQQVDTDLATLDTIDRQVGDFVDRHVAHTTLDPAQAIPGPLHLEINSAFDELERLAGAIK